MVSTSVLQSVFCLLPFPLRSNNPRAAADRSRACKSGNDCSDDDGCAGRHRTGLVDVKPGEDPQAVGLQRAIDRQLQLNEVARFSPPEPPAAAVAEEVAAMRARVGARFEALAASTGLDDERIRQLARETLRIRAYIAQRFGTNAQATEDEARRYYDEHPAEFMRDGVRMPFEEAEPIARQRASADRLRATIDQWIRDLRMRSEVVIVGANVSK